MTKSITRHKDTNAGTVTHSFNLHFTFDEKLKDQVAIDEFLSRIGGMWAALRLGDELTNATSQHEDD